MITEPQETQPLERDRLSILLAVTLSSATLLRFVELPTVNWSVRRILGSALGFSIGGDWLLVALMMGLVATGTFALLQVAPVQGQRERRLGFSLIAPTLGALLASLLLIRATSWPLWLGALILSGLIIGGLVHFTYRAFSPKNPGYALARALLNITDYLLGFALFSLLLGSGGRALIMGPAVLVLSGLLALDLLSASSATAGSVLLFGSVIGILEAEATWVLSYWPLSAWSTATLLTIGLYLQVGIIYQYLLNKLDRRVLLEFIVLALLIFIFILWVKP